MAPWSVLEIPEDADARSIKRAYAKKLKLTRPDDDPQGFQELHDAYKWALELYRYRQDEQSDPQSPLSADRSEDIEKDSILADLEITDSQASLQELEVEAVNDDPTQSVETIVSSQRQIESAVQGNQTQVEETQIEETEEDDERTSTIDENEVAPSEENDPELQQKIEEYQQLLDRVDELLGNNRLYPQERNWKFLEDTPYLLDEEFNWNLGLQVFLRVLQHNSDTLSQEGKKRGKGYSSEVTDNVIQYCDLLFGWRTNAQYLYGQSEDLDASIVLDKLADGSAVQYPSQPLRGGAQLVLDKGAQYQSNDKDEGELYYFGGLFQRGIAVVIDVLILFVVFWVLLSIVQFFSGSSTSDELDSTALGFAMVGYFFMALIMESSSWQATPGKRLMGFQVTRKDLSRMGYGLGLWRMIMFMITLPFFKFIWVVNAFLGGNLIHDRLSRTHVINVKKR